MALDEKKQARRVRRVRHSKSIAPLRPSAGLEAWYRKKLKQEIKKMSGEEMDEDDIDEAKN